MNCEQVHILFSVFREPGKDRAVLVTFREDFGVEQKRVISHDTESISSNSIAECIQHIALQVLDKSCFADQYSEARQAQREQRANEQVREASYGY